MRIGDRVELEVEYITPEGEGVGSVEGREVRVSGVFPGETAAVRIEAVSRHHPRAHGRLLELRSRAPGRREPPCPQDVAAGGRCGGCALSGLSPEAQREAKRTMLASRFGLEVDALVHGESSGYRFSSKRVVATQRGRLVLGSYLRGSHRVADMEGCLVDHPRIREAADEIARVATDARVIPYDEGTAQGDLRYVWLKTDGERVLVTLVTSAAESHAARVLPELLTRTDGVAHAVQAGKGNVVRGEELRILRGIGHLDLALGGVRAHVGPLGFLQPNPSVAARAYEDLVRGPDGSPLEGALALDLYAGAGVTTALLRQSFPRVVPCESYPESARALGVPALSTERFLEERLAASDHPDRHPDLVVANPPRGGLGKDAAASLVRLGAPRVHLMSCHPEALVRDLAVLLAPAGPYRMVRMAAYDTLPETPHVELVVWLEKAVG